MWLNQSLEPIRVGKSPLVAQPGKTQSHRRASIAAGVLRRMKLDFGDQRFSSLLLVDK